MRSSNHSAALVLAALVLLSASPAPADDWPQWRGPNRDGISKETGLLKKWPEGGPRLLWQANDAGGGYSSPAVVGEHLYLISSKGEADERVQARSVSDGKVIWKSAVPGGEDAAYSSIVVVQAGGVKQYVRGRAAVPARGGRGSGAGRSLPRRLPRGR